MTEIDPEPTIPPCEHCDGGPDTVLVAKKIVTYEFHRPGCPVLTDEAGR
ncbi:MAG: hypothetical protein ACLPXZ_26495 [Mycobacterium sp.]